MPAETLAASASARCRSSIVNGFCQGLRSRCSTPSRLRGVRSSTHSTEAIVPSAMLLATASSGSSSTRWQRIDSPRLTQRLARLWLNWKRPPGSARPAIVARGSLRPVTRALSFSLFSGPSPSTMAPRWASRTATASLRIELRRSSSFSMWTRWWPARSRARSCSPARGQRLLSKARPSIASLQVERAVPATRISSTGWASPSVEASCMFSTTTATSPNWSRSRMRSGHWPLPSRTPLRRVPLVLPRSRTRQPRSVARISAW